MSVIYTVGGATSGTVSNASPAITLTPNGSTTDTVSYASSDPNASFEPASPQTLVNSASVISVTYTGSVVGQAVIAFQSLTGNSFNVNPLTFTELVPVPTTVVLDSYVSGLSTGFSSSATVVALAWSGTTYSIIAGCSFGAVYENVTYDPGSYSCRVTIPASAIPPGDTPRIAWTVNSVLILDTSPQPITVVVQTGVTRDAALAALYAASGQITTANVVQTFGAPIPSNTSIPAFPFFMGLLPDGASPALGRTVTAMRSNNGAAFTACANAPVETGAGWYSINLTPTDLFGNSVALEFTAAGCTNTLITFVSQ